MCADKPSEDSSARGDPYKTLFVSRLSYETEVKDLEREFGRFGPIERVCSSSSCFISFQPLTLHRSALSRISLPNLQISRRRRTEAMHS